MAKIPWLGTISTCAAVRVVVVVVELTALHTRPTTADEPHTTPKQSKHVGSPLPNASVLTRRAHTNLGLCKLQRNNYTNQAAYFTANKNVVRLGGALPTLQQSTLAGCGMGVRLKPTSISLAPNAMMHHKCPGIVPPDSLPSLNATPVRHKIVTFAYLYYRSGPLFYGHLREWQTWPDAYLDAIYFLIVDDGSSVGERAIDVLPPLAKRTPRLSLGFATASCDIRWNIYGARNLLFHVAPTDYVLMLDADTGVPHTFVPAALDMIRRAQDAIHTTSTSSDHQPTKPIRLIFLRFRRKLRRCNVVDAPDEFPSDTSLDVEHPAAMLCSKAAYWLVGGCDEDFAGSYGSTHFRFRAENTPGVKIVVPTNTPLLISHSCNHRPLPATTMSYNDTSGRTSRAKWTRGLSTGFDRLSGGKTWPVSSSRPDRNHSSPHVSRADLANTALFKAKKHGQLRWSTDYIRFDYALTEF